MFDHLNKSLNGKGRGKFRVRFENMGPSPGLGTSCMPSRPPHFPNNDHSCYPIQVPMPFPILSAWADPTPSTPELTTLSLCPSLSICPFSTRHMARPLYMTSLVFPDIPIECFLRQERYQLDFSIPQCPEQEPTSLPPQYAIPVSWISIL